MKCPNCEKENLSNSIYCAYCGKKIEVKNSKDNTFILDQFKKYLSQMFKDEIDNNFYKFYGNGDFELNLDREKVMSSFESFCKIKWDIGIDDDTRKVIEDNMIRYRDEVKDEVNDYYKSRERVASNLQEDTYKPKKKERDWDDLGLKIHLTLFELAYAIPIIAIILFILWIFH